MDLTTALVLLAIAAINAFTAVVSYRTKQKMALLEVNTNHKMDMLLEAKAGEAFGKGVAKERADTNAKAAKGL